MAGRRRIKVERRNGAGHYTDGGEYHDLEGWDPQRHDYEDKKFNSYTRGLGRSLQMKQGGQGIQLFLTGIPNEIENEGLRNLFSRAGKVLYVDKKPSKKEGSTETYGFVTMATKGDAERAIRMFNEFGINHSMMKVRVALSIEELKERNMQRQKYFYQNSDFDDELSADEMDGGQRMDAAVLQRGAQREQRERDTAAARSFLGKGRGQVLQVALSETFGDIPPQQRGAPRLHPGDAAMADNTGLLAVTNPLAVNVNPDNSAMVSAPGGYPGHRPKPHIADMYNDYAYSNQSGYGNMQFGHGVNQGYLESTPYGVMETSQMGLAKRGTRGMELMDSSMQSLRSRMEEDPLMVTPVGRGTTQTQVTDVPTQRPIKAPSELFMRQECSLCGNLGSLRCSQCKAPYCSRVCQREDWRTHKNICLTMKRDQELTDAFTSQFDLTVGDELIPKVKDLMEKAAGPLDVKKKTPQPSPKASATNTPSPRGCKPSPQLKDNQSGAGTPRQQNTTRGQQKLQGQTGYVQQPRGGTQTRPNMRQGRNQQQRQDRDLGYTGQQAIRTTSEMSPRDTVPQQNNRDMSQSGQERPGDTYQNKPRGAPDTSRNGPYSQRNLTEQQPNRNFDKPKNAETAKTLSNQVQNRNQTQNSTFDKATNNNDWNNSGQNYNNRSSSNDASVSQENKKQYNRSSIDSMQNKVSKPMEHEHQQSIKSSSAPVDTSTPSKMVASKKSVTPPPPPKKTIQSATMPMNDVIEVMLTEVKDPGCFYVQLLTQDCIEKILHVTARLVEKYSGSTPCDVTSVLCGELYAGRFSEDQQWYRVQVTEMVDGRTGGMIVRFVDFGNSEATSLSELRQLEHEMQVIPAQAVLCSIEGVQPIGSDWNIPATKLIEYLTPNVKYRASCKSVVNSPLGKLHLVDLSSENNEPIRQRLISNGLAQMGDSGSQPRDKPAADKESPASVFRARDLVLVASQLRQGQTNTCLITDAQTPVEFGLQVINEEFNMFSQKLQEVYNTKAQSYRAKEVGELVVCQYAGDSNWYRAEVKELSDQGAVVVYIDFLNTELVPLERVRVAERWCTDIPVQGIHCMLYGVKAPSDGNWPSETISLMTEVGNNPVKATVKEIRGNIVQVELITLGGVSVNVKMNQILGLLEMVDKPVEVPKKMPELATKPVEVSNKPAALPVNQQATSQTKPVPKHAEVMLEKPAIVTKEPISIEPGKLALDGSEVVVSVTFIAAPDKLYVQKQDIELLESLRTIQIMLTQSCSEGSGFKPKPGDYVAAKYTDNVWYRGLVLEGCKRISGTCTVLFVDYGNTEIVETNKVAEMDVKYCSLPCMAIQCQMKGTEKLNSENLVTELQCLVNSQFTASCRSSKDGVYSVELSTMDGNSVNELVLQMEGLQMGESSDPEVEQQQYASNIQKDTEIVSEPETAQATIKVEAANNLYDQNETSQGKSEVQTPQQNLFASKQNVPQTTHKMEDCSLPLDGTDVLAIVVYVERLDNFFIQPADQAVQLKLAEIQQGLCHKSEANQTIHKPKVGEFVAAKYTEDDCTMWYRCKVLDLASGKVQVFILDYGNVDWVPENDIRQLPEVYLAEPAVAVKCQLKGCTGKEDEAIVNDFNAVKDTPVNVKALKKQPDGSYLVDILLSDANATSVTDFLLPQDPKDVQTTVTKEIKTEELVPKPFVQIAPEPGVVQETVKVKQENPVKTESQNPGVQLRNLDLTIGQTLSAAVIWVDDIRSFYIQQADETLLTEFSEMMANMLVHYGEITKAYSPRVGEIVAAYYNDGEQSLWYRSEVVNVTEKTCCVSFCDYGNTDTVLLKDIRELDQKYTVQPRMAIYCSLAGEGVQTEEMLERLKLIMNIELKVTAVSNEGEKYNVKLQTLDGASLNTDLGLTLTEDASCTSPTRQSEPLPMKVKTPPCGERKSFFIQTLSKSRPTTNELEVVITSITSPQLFHCQELKDDPETLSELKLLTDAMKLQCETESQQDRMYEVGELCCARFPVDCGDWYRCTILEFLSDGTTARVEYVDFGNQETLPVSQIHPATDEYTHLPLLAFKCSLSGVGPVDQTWTSDALCEMVKFQDRPLVAHINSIHNDVYEMTVTDEDGVNIGDSLVTAGVAKPL